VRHSARLLYLVLVAATDGGTAGAATVLSLVEYSPHSSPTIMQGVKFAACVAVLPVEEKPINCRVVAAI